jgi:hypothetical protein
MEEFMKKLGLVAALAFALTGAAAHVAYAGTCAGADCTPSESSKTGDASKPSADAKEPCSQSSCRKDDGETHRQAAKDAAKESAKAAAKAIFEAVMARNSARHSRDQDTKPSN